MTTHQLEFESRLARIKAGQGYVMSTVYVGNDLAFRHAPTARRRRAKGSSLSTQIGILTMVLGALALGFAGHAVERYADWALGGAGGAPLTADLNGLRILLSGFCLAILAGRYLGLNASWLLPAKLLGCFAGMMLFHNLVHLWPMLFEQLFSAQWVEGITSVTQPNSAAIFERSITL